MMNIFSKTILMIALVASTIFISSCGDDDDESSVPAGWTEAQIEEGKTECVADGSSEEACDCLIDKIASEWTYDEFQADESDEGTTKVISYALDCGISFLLD